MKILNFRPLFACAISFICGILLAHYFNATITYFKVAVIITLLISCVLFIKINIENKNLRRIGACAFLILLFLPLGIFFCNSKAEKLQSYKISEGYYEVVGKVKKINKYDNYCLVRLTDLCFYNNAEETSLKGDMNFYVYCDSENEKINFDFADNIKFYAYVKNSNAFSEDGVDLKRVSNNVLYTASCSADKIARRYSDANIFEKVTLKIKKILFEHMDYDEASLTYAMLVGSTEETNAGLLKIYRSVGIAHIFSVSGLHINFLYAILAVLLSKLKINKSFKTILIILCLTFYSGVCGFSLSSIRAVIFCSLFMINKQIGKKNDILNIWALSAIFTLFVNPLNLFNYSFILSYACVLSIVIFTPICKRLLFFMPKNLSKSLSLILGVQMGSLPISFMLFGYLPTTSIIANFVGVPLVSLLFPLIIASIVLTGIFNFFGFLFFIPNNVIRLFSAFVNILSSAGILKFGKSNMLLISIFYYLAFLLLSQHVNFPKKISLWVKSIGILIFVSVLIPIIIYA